MSTSQDTAAQITSHIAEREARKKDEQDALTRESDEQTAQRIAQEQSQKRAEEERKRKMPQLYKHGISLLPPAPEGTGAAYLREQLTRIADAIENLHNMIKGKK